MQSPDWLGIRTKLRPTHFVFFSRGDRIVCNLFSYKGYSYHTGKLYYTAMRNEDETDDV